MESEKIKSPKTNRYIYINGEAYHNLITKEGYKQDYLLSLPRITVDKPMSPKYKKIVNTYLTGVDDANLEILRQTDDIYNICQTNKYFYQLCMKNQDIKEKYLQQQKIHKIHERLNNLFTFFNKYKNVYIKFINPFFKKHDVYYLRSNYFYVTNHNMYGINKSDEYSIRDTPDGYSTVKSKQDMYDVLFNLLNRYPNIKIRFINLGTTNRYKSLKNVSDLTF
jgi:hypothetical protein